MTNKTINMFNIFNFMWLLNLYLFYLFRYNIPTILQIYFIL